VSSAITRPMCRTLHVKCYVVTVVLYCMLYVSTIAVCRIIRDRDYITALLSYWRKENLILVPGLLQDLSRTILHTAIVLTYAYTFVMDRTDSMVLNTPYDFFLREMSHL